MVRYLCRSLFRNTGLYQACAGAYFFASYFCKCWTRGSILLVVGSLLFIGGQYIALPLLLWISQTKWNSCIVVCIPRSIMKKIASIHESMKETCVPVQLVHVFFWLKACSWFLAHVFSYDLVYTTGGPPDFIVVLLIICYHWNLIRLFRTVLTETYDLRKSYQCAIFITTVSKEHRLIYSWLWWDL